MPKDHCTHMQFLIKQKEKNEDIRITCAEIAKYNKWKSLQSTTILQGGKNMPVFKNSIIHGESLHICVYVSYHC